MQPDEGSGCGWKPAHSPGGRCSLGSVLSSPRWGRSWSVYGRLEVARLRRSRRSGLAGAWAGTEALRSAARISCSTRPGRSTTRQGFWRAAKPSSPRPGGRGARGCGRGRARARRAGPLAALPPATPRAVPDRRPRPVSADSPNPEPLGKGPLGVVPGALPGAGLGPACPPTRARPVVGSLRRRRWPLRAPRQPEEFRTWEVPGQEPFPRGAHRRPLGRPCRRRRRRPSGVKERACRPGAQD